MSNSTSKNDTRPCEWCKESYESVNVRQKFCTRTCYRSYHSKRTGVRNNAQRSESGRYVFRHIKDRCTNPKSKSYPQYGGRGIKCEFESNKEFVAWYNSSDICKNCGTETDSKNKVSSPVGKQVDRIDASGPYSKTNCRILCRTCNQFLAHGKRYK
jgi:hypothetical protein